MLKQIPYKVDKNEKVSTICPNIFNLKTKYKIDNTIYVGSYNCMGCVYFGDADVEKHVLYCNYRVLANELQITSEKPNDENISYAELEIEGEIKYLPYNDYNIRAMIDSIVNKAQQLSLFELYGVSRILYMTPEVSIHHRPDKIKHVNMMKSMVLYFYRNLSLVNTDFQRYLDVFYDLYIISLLSMNDLIQFFTNKNILDLYEYDDYKFDAIPIKYDDITISNEGIIKLCDYSGSETLFELFNNNNWDFIN